MNAKLRLLAYMTDNDGWHYGLDLAAACGVWRCMILFHLASLEDRGLIERRIDPLHGQANATGVRQFSKLPMYRSHYIVRPQKRLSFGVPTQSRVREANR